MRALVLTTSYPVRARSLSGSFVRDLLLVLRAAGWRFEVVTPAGGAGAPAPRDAGVVVREARYLGEGWAGGLAHARGLPETLASEPWKWLLAPALVGSLEANARAALAARPADLVWSHWLFPAGLVGARVARSRGVPHLATAHGADVHLLEGLVRIPGARRLLEAAWAESRVVAPSAHTARRVSAALGGRAVGVCPLPARGAGDPAPLCPAATAGPPGLLFVGRFEPIKGPDVLLEACAALEHGQVREVVLAGSGSLEPRLRARASRLAHPTRFLGVVGSGAKLRALERTDALVVPSRRLPGGRGEGFPHAAMEALACGRAVIAPREGALGDWLTRTGAGLTFDPGRGDAERTRGLAETLRRFAGEPALRRALAVRAREAGREFRPAAAVPGWVAQLAAGRP